MLGAWGSMLVQLVRPMKPASGLWSGANAGSLFCEVALRDMSQISRGRSLLFAAWPGSGALGRSSQSSVALVPGPEPQRADSGLLMQLCLEHLRHARFGAASGARIQGVSAPATVANFAAPPLLLMPAAAREVSRVRPPGTTSDKKL